jgi:uncharacterized repeat protein (TIGR03803 family)
MSGKRFSAGLRATVAIFTVTLLGANSYAASVERVLHNFTNSGKGGYDPYASLVSDGAGNLYGTTTLGGVYGQGTVFELTPRTGGGWKETVLHSFNNNGKDGCGPTAGLVFDAVGNLYGTTSGCGAYHKGTVFQLTPKTGGGWRETLLRSFGVNSSDGYFPAACLIIDHVGKLYGTTSEGGAYGYGTVFELAPKKLRGWIEKVLHNFDFNSNDGYNPEAGLISDASGNLYGTTSVGGVYGYGTVFELTPQTGGGWTEAVLHNFNFNGSDGEFPEASLILDTAGNLYGTTSSGGAYGYGTVFELTKGTWVETVLYNFGSASQDGNHPYAGLILDSAGNLYGTTSAGGVYGYGTVFALTFNAGNWTETIRHNFNNNSKDGYSPWAGLTFDAAGNLYGATSLGGTSGYGTVFEVTH